MGGPFISKNIMNDDEYIPPYADDPKLIELRGKIDILSACGSASKHADDTHALAALRAAHPNATQLYPTDELHQIIRNCRNQREDFSAHEDLEHRHFTLSHAIDSRIEELGFEELYRPLMNASPVKLAGLTRLDFLAALFPQGTSVLMLDSSKTKKGLPWNVELGMDFGAWFWPLPVLDEGEDGEWVEKSKESVAAWTFATANFDDGTLELMRDLIISREIPVRVVMSTNAGTTVVFAIDAPNEVEWRKNAAR